MTDSAGMLMLSLCFDAITDVLEVVFPLVNLIARSNALSRELDQVNEADIHSFINFSTHINSFKDKMKSLSENVSVEGGLQPKAECPLGSFAHPLFYKIRMKVLRFWLTF